MTNWRLLLDRRFLTVLCFGFSSGLPLYTLIYMVQAWLATAGVNVKLLGLIALAGLPYTFKFLWAPLMDRYTLPLGRRRGWILLTQLCLLGAICTLGLLNPLTQLTPIMAAWFGIAFLSASQDVVIDAYRREILPDEMQGVAVALSVNAYKVAQLAPSALGLMLADHLRWPAVFAVIGAFMLIGVLATLLSAEPAMYGRPPKDLREAIILPFKEFVQRDSLEKALLVVAFVLLYKIGDSMATALSTKFYLDLGFTTTQIARAANFLGLWASVLGGFVGGVWMLRLGANRSLWVFGALQAIAILGFALLARVGAVEPVLAGVMGFESFASTGLGTAALAVYITRQTDPRYTATQYALFSSLAAVPRTVVNASVGFIVAETGWFYFFLVCFVLAFPAMLMLPKIAPWSEKS
jgi:PAT family beta-lactamase induction signal transducer AmpG